MSTASVVGVDIDTRPWIGGRRGGSAATFPDISPVDERPIAEVARGAETEAGAAVQAARQAFSGWAGGTWSFDSYADVKNTVFAPEGWRSDG